MLREASRSAWIASRKRSSQARATASGRRPASSVCSAICRARLLLPGQPQREQRRAQRRRVDRRRPACTRSSAARIASPCRPAASIPASRASRSSAGAVRGQPGERRPRQVVRRRVGGSPAPASASSAAMRGSGAGAARAAPPSASPAEQQQLDQRRRALRRRAPPGRAPPAARRIPAPAPRAGRAPPAPRRRPASAGADAGAAGLAARRRAPAPPARGPRPRPRPPARRSGRRRTAPARADARPTSASRSAASMRVRIGTCSPRSWCRKASGSGPAAAAARPPRASGSRAASAARAPAAPARPRRASGSRKRASSACCSAGDRADLLAERQRDLGRVPVAAARQAEDPRRQRRRQRRVLPQRRAGLGGVVEQQPDVEPAAEELRRVRPGAVDQRPRLLQRPDLEQPVDRARPAPPTPAAGARRRIGLGQQQRDGTAPAPPARPPSGCARIRSRTRVGRVRPPERAREAGRLRRQQPDRVAADRAERRDGDLVGRRRGGARRAAGSAAAASPRSRCSATARGWRCAARRRAPGSAAAASAAAARPASARRARRHCASIGSSTSRCGAGRSEKIAKPTRPTNRDQRQIEDDPRRMSASVPALPVPA